MKKEDFLRTLHFMMDRFEEQKNSYEKDNESELDYFYYFCEGYGNKIEFALSKKNNNQQVSDEEVVSNGN